MPCHCARCGLPIITTGNPLAVMVAKTLAKKVAKNIANKGINHAEHHAHGLVEMAQKEATKAGNSAHMMIKDSKKTAKNMLNRI
jgi:hypothetical protein